jgi:hypothetical protein
VNPVVSAQQAVFYVLDASNETPRLTLLASYADQGQSGIGRQIGFNRERLRAHEGFA